MDASNCKKCNLQVDIATAPLTSTTCGNKVSPNYTETRKHHCPQNRLKNYRVQRCPRNWKACIIFTSTCQLYLWLPSSVFWCRFGPLHSLWCHCEGWRHSCHSNHAWHHDLVAIRHDVTWTWCVYYATKIDKCWKLLGGVKFCFLRTLWTSSCIIRPCLSRLAHWSGRS